MPPQGVRWPPPVLEGFSEAEGRNEECGRGVRPPEPGNSVEDQGDEDAGRKPPIKEGHRRFGGEGLTLGLGRDVVL